MGCQGMYFRRIKLLSKIVLAAYGWHLDTRVVWEWECRHASGEPTQEAEEGNAG